MSTELVTFGTGVLSFLDTINPDVGDGVALICRANRVYNSSFTRSFVWQDGECSNPIIPTSEEFSARDPSVSSLTVQPVCKTNIYSSSELTYSPD
jgi:hypothetical protein